jgi:hypothetical protein
MTDPTILVTTMGSERREVLERLLSEWNEFNRVSSTQSTVANQTVYTFAYWLVRYSGWVITPPPLPIETGGAR